MPSPSDFVLEPRFRPLAAELRAAPPRAPEALRARIHAPATRASLPRRRVPLARLALVLAAAAALAVGVGAAIRSLDSTGREWVAGEAVERAPSAATEAVQYRNPRGSRLRAATGAPPAGAPGGAERPRGRARGARRGDVARDADDAQRRRLRRDTAAAAPARPGYLERTLRDAVSVVGRVLAWMLYVLVVASPFVALAALAVVAERARRRRAEARLLERAA